MRKTVKRILDRLRTATNGRFRKPTSAREGLQLPQRLQALSVPARAPRPR
jgi:hypothetical protein